MSDDLVVKKIKALPALPLVAHKLIQLMQQDSCSADDVTRVLSSDQGLAGRVLKLANSSFYGMSGQVGSVSRGVVLLGFSAIRSMALGLGMAQTLRKAGDGLDLAEFWRHAIHVAAGARTLARVSGRVDGEEAFVAGLLHDLGRLVLEMVAPGYSLRLGDVDADDLLDAEAAAVGMAHTKAGQKIVQHWHLPERLGQVIRFHHHPSQWRHDDSLLTPTAILADQMARALGCSLEPGPHDPPVDALAATLGIDLTETEDLLAQTRQEVQRTHAFLEVAGIDLEEMEAVPAAASGPGGTYVYLGSDAARAAWLAGVLGIHGLDAVPMREYLGGAEAGDGPLVLLDPGTLRADQVGKLTQLLVARQADVAVIGDNAPLADTPLAHARRMPLAISAADLQPVAV
jgi:putative nucleotidyltransferase with HDIG domain